MTLESSLAAEGGAAPRLNSRERRVLGVLIEKALCTPEYYPMTVNALVAGCNQKNNRDPLTAYTADEVESTLQELETRGLAASVIGETGRVARWRQELARALDLSAVDLAVLGELLLRGPQSEGDLRGRAGRMRPIADLPALRALLKGLADRPAPLVVCLTSEAVHRGARYSHTLYPEHELPTINAEGESPAASASRERAPDQSSRCTSGPSPGEELAEVKGRLDALEKRVSDLEQKLL